VNLRVAVRADRDAILRLDRGSADGSERAGVIDRAIESGECFVATDSEGQPVGYAVLEYSFFQHGFVPLVYVAAASRRQGIGTALMTTMCQRCRTRKLFTSTNESNQIMRRLLTRLGFVRSGVIHNLDAGDPELVFFRDLGS
jgi:GNAT superfamily N-acetyltransferase